MPAACFFVPVLSDVLLLGVYREFASEALGEHVVHLVVVAVAYAAYVAQHAQNLVGIGFGQQTRIYYLEIVALLDEAALKSNVRTILIPSSPFFTRTCPGWLLGPCSATGLNDLMAGIS